MADAHLGTRVAPPAEIARRPPQAVILGLLGAAVLGATVLHMTVGLRGNLAFALQLRMEQLAALVTVSVAVALATVVFQTVTANRILTPSLIGLDSLYILIQTGFVFILGGVGVAAFGPVAKFAAEALLLSALSFALFLPLMRARTDLTLLLLAGAVLGILFRSLASLLARLIDPNSFAIVQALRVADFNTVNAALVWPCLGLTAGAAVLIWRLRHVLDILALGPDAAVGLGVDWRRTSALLLVLVGLLTAVATALVGPLVLFGLIVTAIAGPLGGERHAWRLPIAAAVAVLLLVAGQTVLARILGYTLPVGVVIEFGGGLVFIALLLRRR